MTQSKKPKNSESTKGQTSESTKTETAKEPIDITSKLEVFNRTKGKNKTQGT
jgi:hypothetical protein